MYELDCKKISFRASAAQPFHAFNVLSIQHKITMLRIIRKEDFVRVEERKREQVHSVTENIIAWMISCSYLGIIIYAEACMVAVKKMTDEHWLWRIMAHEGASICTESEKHIILV